MADFDTTPQRAFVWVGKVEDNTREGLAQRLREFADAVEADCCPGRSFGGGCSGSHIIEFRVNEAVSHDEYFRQLEAYLAAKRSESLTVGVSK